MEDFAGGFFIALIFMFIAAAITFDQDEIMCWEIENNFEVTAIYIDDTDECMIEDEDGLLHPLEIVVP